MGLACAAAISNSAPATPSHHFAYQLIGRKIVQDRERSEEWKRGPEEMKAGFPPSLRTESTVYWLTRSSIMVPLSIFALFFSELNTDPSAAVVPVVVNFRSGIPTAP